MRMRRKKYLDERLEQCSGWLLPYHTEGLDARAAILDKDYIDFTTLFGNENPVELEVGCGKGGFICQLAALHPETNYIAVEKQQNVIVSACEAARDANLQNVRFMSVGAEYLEKFLPPKSISRIYLNFSCPFPKRHFANRRLTSPRFLKTYSVILADGAEIHQKTDNMQLFEYSIEQFSTFGYALKNVSLDLHNSGFEGNIETEYEKKFAAAGLPIYRLEAYLPARDERGSDEPSSRLEAYLPARDERGSDEPSSRLEAYLPARDERGGDEPSSRLEADLPARDTDRPQHGAHQAEDKRMKICVYGASSTTLDDIYINDAELLGRKIAEHGFDMVFGGGSRGMMGAAALGAKSAGGKVIGIAPTFFKPMGVLLDTCDEFIYTETMRERKQKMEDLSDAFIVMPGGIGTFDEFFEIFTLKQLDRHDKPLVLLNTNGYYDPLWALMLHTVNEGFLKESSLSKAVMLPDVDSVMNYIRENFGK